MSFAFDHLLHLYHSIWDPSFEVLGPIPKARDPTFEGDGQTSEAQQPSGQGQRIIPETPQPNEQPASRTYRWYHHLYVILFYGVMIYFYLVPLICQLLWNFCWAVALYFVVSLICKLLRKLVIGLLFFLHFAISYIIIPRSWKDLLSIEQPSLDAKNTRFLHDMGIKFKKNTNAQNWLDISLTRGVLKIPALPIHQRTIIILRNMLAFEELNSQSRKKNFTAFAKFMDTLIDTEKDVAILRKCGIIQSKGTDKEVADFFNNLCTVTVLDRGGHHHGLEEELFKNLESYYKDNRYEVMIRQWRMTLIPDSLRSPWAIPATIVSLIVVLPSTLQTFNTIYSLINPPPHPPFIVSNETLMVIIHRLSSKILPHIHNSLSVLTEYVPNFDVVGFCKFVVGFCQFVFIVVFFILAS